MAWSDIETRIRGQLGDSGTSRWTQADLVRWYNQGAQLQHRIVFRAAKQLENKRAYRLYENEYIEQFLKSSTGTFTSGTQDYSLPTDFWRMARVTVNLSPPTHADSEHFDMDWDTRNMPHCAPVPGRPKYALVPSTTAATNKIRFYVAEGDKTVPRASTSYTIYYYRQPIDVNQSASPPVDIDIGDPFHDGPIAWTCYQANLKYHLDAEPYRQQFQVHAQSILDDSIELPGGPSAEEQ